MFLWLVGVGWSMSRRLDRVGHGEPVETVSILDLHPKSRFHDKTPDFHFLRIQNRDKAILDL